MRPRRRQEGRRSNRRETRLLPGEAFWRRRAVAAGPTSGPTSRGRRLKTTKTTPCKVETGVGKSVARFAVSDVKQSRRTFRRHCEERSDEAIQSFYARRDGLP